MQHSKSFRNLYSRRPWIQVCNLIVTIFRNVWGDIKQIMTAFTRAMVKTMTASVIPGAIYFPSASPRENSTLRGSPRES